MVTMIRIDDATALAAETFGEPSGRPALLFHGGGNTMVAWHDDFCAMLVARGVYVIRYDRRETGRSTLSQLGAADYSADDLVTDAVAVLDHLGVVRANLVGLSHGGEIAQRVAIEYPERLASLTLISSTPVAGEEASDLPGWTPEIAALFEGDGGGDDDGPDWSDRAAAADFLVEAERPFAGAGFDEATTREIAERTFDTTASLPHLLRNTLPSRPGPPRREALGAIDAPALVIHGADDQMYPLPHGEALAREIPGARLLVLDGVGHGNLPRSTWTRVTDAIGDVAR